MSQPVDLAYTRRVEARALLLAIVILAGLVCLFAGLFAWQFMKKAQVEPVFLKFDSKANQVVRIERGTLPIEKQTLLRSAMLRAYVKNRLTINHIDEQVRYSKVRAMSSESVYNDFKKQMALDNPNSPLNNTDYESHIEVVRDTEIADNTYQIAFIQTEIIDGVEQTPTRWNALIEYAYKPYNIERQDRFLNIDGITVERFVVQKEQ